MKLMKGSVYLLVDEFFDVDCCWNLGFSVFLRTFGLDIGLDRLVDVLFLSFWARLDNSGWRIERIFNPGALETVFILQACSCRMVWLYY